VNAPATPPERLHVVITPTGSDIRRLARFVTRRMRVTYLLVGSLLLLASALSFSDGDGLPFLSGLVTGWLGASLFIASLLLPQRVARRLPSFVTEPRTFDVDQDGIRQRGSMWAEECAWKAFRSASLTRHFILLRRERYMPVFALPRSAFAEPFEAELVQILRVRGLLP
jgi:hypothetical protein